MNQLLEGELLAAGLGNGWRLILQQRLFLTSSHRCSGLSYELNSTAMYTHGVLNIGYPQIIEI